MRYRALGKTGIEVSELGFGASSLGGVFHSFNENRGIDAVFAAVDAGIMGFEMYRNGQQFYGGDGLVLKGVENTIRNISRLGRIGMKETDKEIIKMMIGQ